MRMFRRAKQAVVVLLPPSTKLFLKRIVGRTAQLLGRGKLRSTSNTFDAFLARYDLATAELDLAHKRGALSVPEFTVNDFVSLKDDLRSRYQDLSANRKLSSSIIIPVFNKANFTFQCLRSLTSEVDLTDSEIIVVNNASTDDTSEMLSYVADFVRVINNEENRGFVDACNQGAAAAKGKYLVFLNNDTLVLKDWLTALLDTVESNSKVGAVGSMFLYPDGSIQEAGAIVWKTGEAHHYGWGKSPDDHRFNFAREVDYCSGASLLIRKELFDQLGGFDRLYAPAYYEDADLCFGVRSLGYKVVYQPASKLIHFEGATAGTDVREGVKQYQLRNREKFYRKWQAVLEQEHYENSPTNEHLASDRRRGPEVIVFDDRVPTPSRDAGSARMMFILEALRSWSKPLFVYNSAPLDKANEAALWPKGIETAPLIDYPRLLRQRNFEVAIMSRPEVAQIVMGRLRRRRPRIKIIFDMVDVYFVRLDREYTVSGDPKLAEESARFKKLELELVSQSDLVWCNSSEDKQRVEAEGSRIPIEIIPTIHLLRGRGKPFHGRRDLFFAGHFAHRPNADGIRFFLREVFPLVKQSLPEVQFHIAGTNPPPDIQALASEDVHVLGFVPDIEPYFQSARVFVAPVRFGAGVKGKIGDSLSYGLPVVTTSVGAEGMGLSNREQAMIADTAEDFAKAVVEVYQNGELWQRLSDNGYSHVESYFGPDVVDDVVRRSIGGIETAADGTRMKKIKE